MSYYVYLNDVALFTLEENTFFKICFQLFKNIGISIRNLESAQLENIFP